MKKKQKIEDEEEYEEKIHSPTRPGTFQQTDQKP